MAPDREPDARPDLVAEGTLRDGLRVVVRRLGPQDRGTIEQGFRGLSDRSRYLRFLAPKKALSRTGLDALVDQVDQVAHVTLWWPRSSQDDVLLGDARFIRLADDPHTADVAVTIADEIQGQGAGTLMMRALVQEAHHLGVRRFSATMAADNEASYRMMRRAGSVERNDVSDAVREIVVDLGPYDEDRPPDVVAP